MRKSHISRWYMAGAYWNSFICMVWDYRITSNRTNSTAKQEFIENFLLSFFQCKRMLLTAGALITMKNQLLSTLILISPILRKNFVVVTAIPQMMIPVTMSTQYT